MPKKEYIDPAKYVLSELAEMKTVRSGLESDWQDVVDYLCPNAPQINSDGQSRIYNAGSQRSDLIFDSTPIWALDQLACGLHAFLTSPVDRWFQVRAQDPRLMEDDDVRAWCQDVEDIMYYSLASPRCGFSMAAHEYYIDAGSFGTPTLYQDLDPKTMLPCVRSEAVADMYIGCDEYNRVDRGFREIYWSVRQARKFFGDDWPTSLDTDYPNENTQLTFIHAVFPRTDRVPFKINNKNMPLASFYVLKEKKMVLRESGYRSLPFHTSRWRKRSGSVYGDAPGLIAMPDIKMLNEMRMLILMSKQKAVNPPTVFEADGYEGALDTTQGGVIWKERGAEAPYEMGSKARFDAADAELDTTREQILRAFFNDMLRMQKDKIEMTAFEVQDRRNEKLMQMAPMLGRQYTEFLTPFLSRHFELLDFAGWIRRAPSGLKGGKIMPEFIGPAARAQEGVKGIAMQQFIQALTPLMGIDQAVFDAFDTGRYAKMLGRILGVPHEVMRIDSQIDAIREARAKDAKMQQVIEAAPEISGAIKDIADARATGRAAA